MICIFCHVFGGRALERGYFGRAARRCDVEDLAHWLRRQKLLHRDQGYLMTHAGLPGCWSVPQAQELAWEVESVIGQSDAAAATAEISYRRFFADMYGDKPAVWRNDLQGMDRLRCIVNYLTRMRL